MQQLGRLSALYVQEEVQWKVSWWKHYLFINKNPGYLFYITNKKLRLYGGHGTMSQKNELDHNRI